MPKHPVLPTITALPEHSVDRRRVLKAAAWSLPVIAVAVAAPAATASLDPVTVGDTAPLLSLDGTCAFGKKGPGFTLTVQGAPLPAGSTILVTDAKASGDSWIITSLTGATIVKGKRGTFTITLGADLPIGTYSFGPHNNANVCEYTATLSPKGTYNPSSKLTGTVDPQHNKHDKTCTAS